MTEPSARCWILNAFDVARAISLPECRRALATEEVTAGRRPEWPHLFGLDERPLVWHAEPETVSMAGLELDFQPRAIIYDFGSVSVALGCRLPGPVASWRHAAEALRNPPELRELARRVVTRLLDLAAGAIEDRRPAHELEQYTVFQMDRVAAESAATWLRDDASTIAQVLRGDTVALADEEIAEALTRRLSYSTQDAVVIDSSAAIILDDEFEDTLAVIDFANCERLSMRVLDEDLDSAIAEASRLLRSRAWRWKRMISPWGRDVTRLTQLTFDAAAEFEAIENAIKLTGDHYLARVYRMAIERLDLRAFREGITRKLSSLWSIQGVFLDQTSSRRSELLEWIIIGLITLEIVHALR
ncbi:MAG TPA: hypothetical protein VK698_00335 [Kofleriaceae bacterium]|nr:hypothetical protein [Kofleriaceae bacterium]